LHCSECSDWHIASFRCAAKLVGYWTNNGQRSARALTGSAAIDQKATSSNFNQWLRRRELATRAKH
jgi:hypothetical protein